MSVKRGDIYYADLSPVVGSEQGGMRPVLIIQNDVGNRYSPTVIAAAITSRMGKTKLPTHIDVHAERAGLSRDSVVLLEQLRTLDKRRLKERMGHLDEEIMWEIDNAIAVSLGLVPHGARLPAREPATRRAPFSAVASVAPPSAAEVSAPAASGVTATDGSTLAAASPLAASAGSPVATSLAEQPGMRENAKPL
ncbi:MAG: type II toxin-antitoxin system PemK/MazF family toxin [Ruminococcaceae bacterium]|nr:type II toxin-antitoxin system PemK/MazF family toxin [Oscillospiraceae bacterium]